MRPSPFLNEAFCFILGYAAQRHRVEIHAVCVMSNHFHLIVTDPAQNLSKFMGQLDMLLARLLNAYHSRSESFFSQPDSFNDVRLVDSGAVLEKLVYVLTNPVNAGLVFCGSRWPGVWLTPRRIGRPKTIQRPRFFFRENGPVPEEVTLEITKPPLLAELSVQEYRHRVEEAVAARERTMQQLYAEEGRKFLGERAILAQSVHARPETREVRMNLNPHVACVDPWLRRVTLRARQQFLDAYREALATFCDLFKRKSSRAYQVVFPRGTYWMRERYGVRCAGPPAPS